jgi:ribonuclease HI
MVSHLMFADDLLLFGEASEKQMQCVMDTLNKFCSLSGQEVSQEKTSILFSKNVRRCMRDKLLHMSGFRETYDLGKYLGVPLNGRAPKRADYHYLIDQVQSKLSAWKAKQLSFAGRLTLAKSVLEAVPIYPMMTEKIPKSCLEDIHRIQRNFIWGEYENVRKFHAVNWNVVTLPKWMGGLGLRNLDVMNQACILKLGWKLNYGSTDFWCQVVKGKYGVHSFANDIVLRPSDSSIWKALLRLKEQLISNTSWCIRNGNSVDAWNHVWIEPGCRVNQLCVVPTQLQSARVCDLVDDHGSWNWQLLEPWIPSNILNKIAAIPPPCEENGSDEPVGICSNNNGYSVTAMYEQLRGIVKANSDPVWSKVWKLNVPERVRCFIWLLLHDRLLTNYRKSRIGLGHAMCNYCGVVEETSLHVMRDCALVTPFWLQVVSLEDRSLFFMEDIQAWISLNLKKGKLNGRGSEWCDFWATACHSLWMWRNKEAHDEDFVRPIHPINYVYKRVEEYHHAKHASDLIDGKEYSRVEIGWKPPSGNFVRLNTDGASKNNNQAGCGGIIRGNQGEWLGGFAKGVGDCSAFVAELWGVFEGLSLAKRMGFRKIELHIDSVAVVHVISARNTNNKSAWSLQLNIRKLLESDWEVQITYVYREANKCADALANEGCQLGREVVFYEDCPPYIKDLVQADVMGITTPRIISV